MFGVKLCLQHLKMTEQEKKKHLFNRTDNDLTHSHSYTKETPTHIYTYIYIQTYQNLTHGCILNEDNEILFFIFNISLCSFVSGKKTKTKENYINIFYRD